MKSFLLFLLSALLIAAETFPTESTEDVKSKKSENLEDSLKATINEIEVSLAKRDGDIYNKIKGAFEIIDKINKEKPLDSIADLLSDLKEKLERVLIVKSEEENKSKLRKKRKVETFSDLFGELDRKIHSIGDSAQNQWKKISASQGAKKVQGFLRTVRSGTSKAWDATYVFLKPVGSTIGTWFGALTDKTKELWVKATK